MTIRYLLFLGALLSFASCKSDKKDNSTDLSTYSGLVAVKATQPIVIDANIDKEWNKAKWQPINNVWLGEGLATQDFKGEYKLMYDENYLYVLSNITDDVLMDEHEDGLEKYWDDDCLEIFIDEDRSKGNHQYNHSAFAYHIALDNKVADLGPDSLPAYYTDHVKNARNSRGMRHLWETSIKIYSDDFKDGGKNIPEILTSGKKMGFAIAYCDNDYSREREHFIGSVHVEGEDKNRGWIDAGIFEELRLK